MDPREAPLLTERPTKATTPGRRLVPLVAAAAGAVIVALAIISFFTIEVCDQQLSGSGAAVSVCRHLQITDPPIVAGGLLLLVCLGAYFTEISGFGITLKREIVDAKKSAQAAHRNAVEAKRGVEEMRESTADLYEGVGHALEQSKTGRERPRPKSEIERLIDQYNEIRFTTPSGGRRTAAMTKVANEMIETTKGRSDFDLTIYLTSDDAGRRLAGFSYLYANPDPQRIPDLIDALLAEDKPFSQYWALQALRKLVETDPTKLGQRSITRLRAFLAQMTFSSDRKRALRSILDQYATD